MEEPSASTEQKDTINKVNVIKPYNLSFFEKIMKKKELVAILKPLYQSLNIDIQSIEAASQLADWSTVAQIAHKLKGSVGYIKANELYAVLENIEIKAISQDQKEMVINEIAPMKRLADEVKRHLALEINALVNELAVAC
jgi:HPt (histidine-containing phosphotransfer) domain-containing protein